MSLFFKRGEVRAMQHWFGFDGAPAGGRSVTPENATYLAPVFSALRHIVDHGSSYPVDAYRKDSESQRVQTSLPVLMRSQNAIGRGGLRSWFGQGLYGIAAHGNAVGWVVEWDLRTGFPSVIDWLRNCDWHFDEAAKQWYVYGQAVPAYQVFHVPWIVPTGCTLGLSPIEHYAAIVRAGLSAQEYADVKRGGGLPPAHLKNTAKKLQTDDAAKIRDRAVAAFSSGQPFVTGSDYDLKLMSIPPNHAQFIETLKLSANQIAAIYGLDPREIGGSADNSLTYTTDESRSLNRIANLRPYIERLEDAVNRVLPERQFIKLNTDATIRADIKTRTEVIGSQIQDGRLSVNEARALEDRPPITGGDYHNVPAPKAVPATREGETP